MAVTPVPIELRASGRRGWLALLSVLLAGAPACSEPAPSYHPEYASEPVSAQAAYRFGVHPLHNPQRLAEVYGPIVAHLNRELGDVTLELEASRSYDDYDRKLDARQFAFALPNPYQTLRALRRGYRVFGKMGDDTQFRGIILVRRDSGLREVTDLKGKAVSFPAPTALAATMMPLYFLHTHGLDANRDITRVFAGSQESSIMNAYLGRTAASATWPPPWEAFKRRSPEVASELEVRWETEPLINNALVARDDVPPEVVSRVAAVLFNLHTRPDGMALLAALPLGRFEPATADTYLPVRRFLDRYEGAIR